MGTSEPGETEPLALHPLTYLADGGEVVVGRADTGTCAVFPADGAALLAELENGRTVADARDWYQRRFGETVDIAEFTATLRELGFVRDAGDTPVRGVRWQRLGRALFSPVAWCCYGLLLVAAVAVCIADTRLVPQRDHLFFSSYLLLVQLTFTYGQVPRALLHELFHLLAGRRIGVGSRIRVSQRFYFVVFETTLDGLAVRPRRQRYLPLLAGMLADVLVAAALTVAAYLLRAGDGSLTTAGRLCLALAFSTLLGLGWQFFVFLRTDIYYLVVTVTGCTDLHETAKVLLRNRFWTAVGRPGRATDESLLHPRDRSVARWYAPLMVLGYLAMAVALATVVLPVLWTFASTALSTLVDDTVPAARLWDAAGSLALTLFLPAVAGLLAVRSHRSRTSNPGTSHDR
ncbi:hypothetical protein [Amycolatopsis suaedae]|uniref:PqqD family protein n=1 Tax=Amycolatopsis suaedae TaxID=2510978 RepID=A0A4Q7JFK8_9PSEU|nr:hypothetical protein [Amycolatopsis suaedae]RZQ65673.1 hypothetical protein EWH70_00825 [Amycolatopsis suaedae]